MYIINVTIIPRCMYSMHYRYLNALSYNQCTRSMRKCMPWEMKSNKMNAIYVAASSNSSVGIFPRCSDFNATGREWPGSTLLNNSCHSSPD